MLEESVRTILAENDSPDIGFDLSINPYRGCEHGCIYCYARPTHSYLNLSPGSISRPASSPRSTPRTTARGLCRRGDDPKLLNLGSATDAYQPIERRLGLTAPVIEVLSEARHAFSAYFPQLPHREVLKT